MKNIAIFTTSRADFGIFTSLIRKIHQNKELNYCLFAGGSHLAPEYGMTIKEIKEYDFKLTGSFDYLLNGDSSESISYSMGIAISKLTNIFTQYQFDSVCILGDRIELLPIVMASIIFKKPIIHIHGGEKSEGVIDEQVRHMITKAAHIHFTACQAYSDNIRKMGESNWRIFNTGALAVDNIKNIKKKSKEDLFIELGLDVSKPTILFTYHPVTLEFNIPSIKQMKNVFSALESLKDFQIVITAPNMEVDRAEIISLVKEKVLEDSNYHYVESLGMNRYYNLLSYCQFVIGNSSSGIIEVPFFKIPTVNVGDRQKGRIRHISVIDTDYSVSAIQKGINKALSSSFNQEIQKMNYQFGDGFASEKMIAAIESIQVNEKLLRKELDF